MAFIDILLMMIIGFVGYLIFKILDLPTPSILGSMGIVILLRMLGVATPALHSSFSMAIQIAIGMSVGIDITKEIVKQLRVIVKPAILMSVWAISISFIAGFLLSRFTDLDFITAILSAAPGGLTEMGLVAQSVGADVGTVTLLQLFRMILTFVLFPMIARRSQRVITQAKPDIKDRFANILQQYKLGNLLQNSIKKYRSFSGVRYLIAILAAITGGIIGDAIGIPAGGMIGAMFLTAAISISGYRLQKSPDFASTIVRVGVGVMIANDFTKDTFLGFFDILLPVTIFTILIFGTAMIMKNVVQRLTSWDPITSFLATAPAGFISMTLLADELKLPALEVSMMQLVRVLTIKTVIPLSIMFLQ